MLYSNHSSSTVTLHSEGVMIHLPTPDFSMPYNVITLSGTVLALLYGGMFAVLLRRFSAASVADFVGDRPITKVIKKIIEFLDADDDDE